MGYQIRLERRAGERTRLLFCTTGILLRKMQLNPQLRGTNEGVWLSRRGGSEQVAGSVC